MIAAPPSEYPRAVVPARSAITATFLFAIAIGLLYEALQTSDRPTHAVVWGGLALGSYAAGLLCIVGARWGARLGLVSWKFGSWVLIWSGAAFGLATVTWSQPQTGTAAEITLSNVLRALWLVAVGITGWAAGYLTGPGSLVRAYAARIILTLGRRFGTEVRSPAAPWILYAIGVVARLATVASTGSLGYVGDASSAVGTATSYGQILSLLSLLAPLAVCVAALQVYRERLPSARITLAVLFLTELAFGAAAGGKQSFVIAVLAVIIPMSASRRRLPKATVIACVFIFLFIVIPFNEAYRSAARSSSAILTVSQAVDEAPGIFRQTLTGQSVVTVLPDSLLFLMQRVREIDSPAIIMQRTGEQIPFSSPMLLVEAPLADLVPRAIWANKPILATGYQFSQQYYELPSTTYTSAAITPVGDLYRHGGWVPVVAGMFLLGCLTRLFDDVLDVRANPQAVLLVLLLFPALVKNESDWVTTLAGIPATLLIWLLAVSLTFRARRSA